MSIEIKVPPLPESVSDATLAKWYKQPGDPIAKGESLVDLETDKVMLEVPAPEDGVVGDIRKPEGSTVLADEILCTLEKAGAKVSQSKAAPAPSTSKEAAPSAPAAAGAAAPQTPSLADLIADLSPAVRRLITEHGVDVKKIKGTGKSGRIVKEDVMALVKAGQSSPSAGTSAAATAPTENLIAAAGGERLEKRVPMTRLRATIANRLVKAQSEAAMLTTFNEVNMQPVMDLRARYRDRFEKKHGVRLGFMAFFVKAVEAALKRYPAVNASIDGSDIVYHGYFDVGIAVASPRGLVVPVLRQVETMSMADIEKQISEYAGKAKAGKLSMEEITGGTFTITNGGVFGSMLSTPILNPPQSAILGMHNIVKRPIVENDEIVIRPVMYLALSYDHRIIDGSESVRFLVTIKEQLEEPARLLLDV